jgi:hypothetical protein
MKKCLLFALLLLGTLGCRKEEVPLPGEVIAREIEAAIAPRSAPGPGTVRVTIFVGTSFVQTYNSRPTFDRFWMVIDQSRINLNELKQYRVVNGANALTLECVF